MIIKTTGSVECEVCSINPMQRTKNPKLRFTAYPVWQLAGRAELKVSLSHTSQYVNFKRGLKGEGKKGLVISVC